MNTVYAYFYHREFELPLECVEDIAQPGANDEAVAYWQPRIALNYWTQAEIVNGLLEYGAWDREELEALTLNELEEKLLWLAAHDAAESMETA
jgi:hypothetical protein